MARDLHNDATEAAKKIANRDGDGALKMLQEIHAQDPQYEKKVADQAQGIVKATKSEAEWTPTVVSEATIKRGPDGKPTAIEFAPLGPVDGLLYLRQKMAGSKENTVDDLTKALDGKPKK